jgi:mannosylglycerate hydrolase
VKKKKIAHIVPHSHWDREWRYPIWKNRTVLVEMMDNLLKLLAEYPDYKQFIMDGQSVVIQDYLEIRPEKSDEVKEYIKKGRITCGPWYTLPDLYPLDGECLVRNLLKGNRYSEDLGKCMKIAYTSFGWGQTAQFPQIFAGFGIDFAVTAKHVNDERAPESEFWWEAPDGTRILTTRLGTGGRSTFFGQTVIEAKYNVKNDDDYHLNWNEAGFLYHKANRGESYEDYFALDDHAGFYPETVTKNLELSWKSTDASVADDIRLFLAGSDFSGHIPELKKIIEIGNAEVEDTEYLHSTLQDYITDFRDNVDITKLRTIRGELRDGPSSRVSGNALTTRIYIKQLNKKVQNVLIHQAEPLSSIISLLDGEYQESFLTKAWEYLLKSHPHDSINGVTQDKTAEDTLYRLNQALEISSVVYENALSALMQRADYSAYQKGDILLFAFNPLPFSVKKVVEIAVDIPKELNYWDFIVLDDRGNELSVQWIDKQEKVTPVHDLHSRPWPFSSDRHYIHLEAAELPACGFRIFKVVEKSTFARSFISGPTYQRTSSGKEICRAHNQLENEFLLVEINTNGTLKITKKDTDQVFDGLHYFEDTGEVGDYWINNPPYNNRIHSSLNSPVQTWIHDNGELSATIGMKTVLEIPAYGHRSKSFFGSDSRRSDEMVQMEIVSYITLKKDARQVDLKVEVDNNARDHRVRVLYPTGIITNSAEAAGHFTVDSRAAMPNKEKNTEYYVDMQTLPQQSFVDVSDGNNGIAFLNNCLTEYELINDGKSTLALTLFRSVRNIICSEMRAVAKFPNQEGGQSLGLRNYDYAICFHTGDWETGKVFRKAREFNTPPTVMQTSYHDNGAIPSGSSFFSIDSDQLIVSAFKKSEDRDSFILRLFNPTGHTVKSKIQFFRNLQEVYLTNLNEERIETLDTGNEEELTVTATSNKIVTLELVFSC